MKKVLFLGLLTIDFQDKTKAFAHLEKKYIGLSRGIKPFIVGRGRPFHRRIWNTEFYLMPRGILVWFFAFWTAFYLCLTKRIDVIVAQSPLVEGFFSSILAKLFNIELIVEIHGDWKEGPFLSRKRKFTSFLKKFSPLLANISLSSADKIRTVANYLTIEAKKIAPGKKYFSFPTFTDLDSFLYESDTNWDKFILSVGQLEKVKGMDILIEAFGKIDKDFKLIIIGEGSERNTLENKIKSLGLNDRVELKGKLSLEQVEYIMKNCYCFVLSSLSEGLPRVLLEAQSLSKPIIASNVGGIPDLIKVGENGFLFEPGNSDDLAQKLNTLMHEPSLAQAMGRKGRILIQENFSNEIYIKNYKNGGQPKWIL